MEIEKYLFLYADCIPVKGAKKSIIMDIGRKELYEIANEYIDLIFEFEKNTIKNVLLNHGQDEIKQGILPFIEFIISNELGHFVEEASEFPKIDFTYNDYSKINNAIIDVREIKHDFVSIFCELNNLGTQYVQIRFFREVSFLELETIVNASKQTSFYSIEIICFKNDEFANALGDFLRKTPILTSITLTCSNKNEIEYVYADEGSNSLLVSKIIYTKQNITSCMDCGIINQRSMIVPDVQGFSEVKQFNSCLNKKISIDIYGNVKNCPSMDKSYGPYSKGRLIDVIKNEDFRSQWNIAKDQISTCKDCEYRYVCSDCRAYVNMPKEDKPFKCKYNPYLTVWEV